MDRNIKKLNDVKSIKIPLEIFSDAPTIHGLLGKDFFVAFLNLTSHRCTVATASGFINATKRIFSEQAMNGYLCARIIIAYFDVSLQITE